MGREYFLRTDRLGFGHWQKSDYYLAWGLWGDFAVTRLIDARGQLSEQQVKERLIQEITNQEMFGVQYWPIFLLLSGEHAGCCGLRPYDAANNIYEIGFHIRTIHWGQGYALEAAQATIHYAFATLQVSGLFAGHNPHNEPSRHLLQKLGFRYTHDEFFPPTGLQHPSYLLTAEP